MLADSLGINLSEEKKIKGQIICAGSNKYTVDTGGEIIVIDARKKIKYKKGDLLTGDFVEIENGAITSVYPRKTRFFRPNVANIDTLLITISNPPKPDFLIVDKLLLSANYCNCNFAIVVNKCDIEKDTFELVKKQYDFCPVFSISSKTKEGIEELIRFLKGKTVAFAGQSAVGKTSIVNALLETQFKTGELSEKLERGRHTTTGSRLLKGDDFTILDTPGFSELAVDISPYDAVTNFPPYEKYLNMCRYPDCTHINEPDCVITENIEKGNLSFERHLRYKEILKEIQLEYGKRYGKKRQ